MNAQDLKIGQAYEAASEHSRRRPHQTIAMQVWEDIDEGIADLVKYLNTIPGVRTFSSCQGTLGEGGPAPYPAYVMAAWPAEIEAKLRAEFEVECLGEQWGYIRPKTATGEHTK